VLISTSEILHVVQHQAPHQLCAKKIGSSSGSCPIPDGRLPAAKYFFIETQSSPLLIKELRNLENKRKVFWPKEGFWHYCERYVRENDLNLIEIWGLVAHFD
jgi:hypothetical protein